MIFNNKVRESGNLSLLWKIYKLTCGFVKPLLGVLVLISALFCFLSPKEGSNSRIIAFSVLILALLIMVFLTAIDKKRSSKSKGYLMYIPSAVRKLEPATLVPLLVFTVVTILPFYILVITSVKNHFEASSLDFTWWPKEGFDLASYAEVLSLGGSWGISVSRALINSFIYAFFPTVAGIFTSSVSAYAFAKLKFKGKKTLFTLLIMTMMMPGCVTMSTSYLLFDFYGWTNSPLPLLIPGIFGGAGTVLFLRESFMGVPEELLEASRMDGAGTWKNFFLIMLPLGKPALTAQFILGFIGKYNDFLGPLIYLNDPKDYTVQILLNFLEGMAIDASMLATTGVVSLVPMLLLYVVFQNKIIDNLSLSSGLKG